MSFLTDEISKRNLPPLLKMNDGSDVIPGKWQKRRKELLGILGKYEYGITPPPPTHVDHEIIDESDHEYANKVIHREIKLTFDTPRGKFSFLFQLLIPKYNPNPYVFLHIAFNSNSPDAYMPAEEITDNGFAIAYFNYNDVVPDTHNGKFNEGLAAMFIENGNRKPDEWGKIGMWAYAASRIVDYLETCPDVNAKHIAVIGHSRLGKTALWAAAQDERICYAISNDSGFGGAALAKGGAGEKVADFLNYGSSDWFCENFKSLAGKENDASVYLHDQHMLLAAIAPRRVCVGSAEFDPGADPKSEFLACVSAGEAYNLLGYHGFITPDAYPPAPTSLFEGRIGYQIRKGTHFFSRYDWLQYIRFIRQ
jgi:hypothetical protein